MLTSSVKIMLEIILASVGRIFVAIRGIIVSYDYNYYFLQN